MNIINRLGEIEEFDIHRIEAAIKAASIACGYKFEEEHIKELALEVPVWDKITIDEIQSSVIEILRDYGYDDIADQYITYKAEHDAARQAVEQDIQYMLNYISSTENAATSSNTDANANVTLKNVANLDSEVPKSSNRLRQRAWMRYGLKRDFPDEPNLYKQYIQDIKDHIIYPHDEASSPTVKNYCEAVQLYPLALEGTSCIDGTGTRAPKHLSSFAGQMGNLLFLLSSQCKGAVAFGEFFNYFDYYASLDFGPEYDLHAGEYADSEWVAKRETIGEKIDQFFQQIVFIWNQPAGNRGSQSPFSNISYYDEGYWRSLFSEFCFPDGTKPLWRRVDWLQRRFIHWFNEQRRKTLLTFPVETMALLTDGKDVIDKSYKDLATEMWSKGHSFFMYLSDNPDSLSSCCRLKNQITDNTFSFTNGLTGVQTGSCNVITLNLNRIVQNWALTHNMKGKPVVKGTRLAVNPLMVNDLYEDFVHYLSEIVKRVQKYHIAFKNNLYMFEKAGQLTASTAGFITMNRLYSTIGLNGINEAAMYFGLEVSYNKDYMDFCRTITETISTLNRKNGKPNYLFNQEFVPAESLGSKNFNWDKEDGYWVPNDGRVLYNSYFYDAHDNTSVLDKLRMHGREFTETLDGGVGCHINLKEHLNKAQYEHLIDAAIEFGTSYFTFNVPNTECKDCGFISKRNVKECPVCGSTNLRWWTRVIGFLRPTEAFDQFRQIEEKQRTYTEKI